MQSLNTQGLGSESVLLSRLAPTLHQLAPGPVQRMERRRVQLAPGRVEVGEVRKRRLALNWPRGLLGTRSVTGPGASYVLEESLKRPALVSLNPQRV